MPEKRANKKRKKKDDLLFEGIFSHTRKVHFIGIGGIGMSGIARIMRNMGFEITGSDMKESDITALLKKEGCIVHIGHNKDNIDFADVVVTSSAISPANEEVLKAKEAGIPVIHRSEMLAEIMRLKVGIAVAGTHGKTTTTSIVSSVCIEGGLNPTSVIGGNALKINSNSALGKGRVLICEADESDGSFLKLNPTISIVTNIDLDHMDYYITEENLIIHFVNFINKTPFYGKNILCFEDERIRNLKNEIEKPYVSYGFDSSCDIWAENVRYEQPAMHFTVHVRGKKLDDFQLSVLGRHNVLNSLAAIGVGLELDIPVKKIKSGLESFCGVARRMYKLGEKDGFCVIDDYGHHPTEIKATLDALKLHTARLIVVFQPHRYTRTMHLYREFAESLKNVDALFLMDIYGAGEEKIKGVSTKLIYNELKKNGGKNVFYISEWDAVKEKIRLCMADAKDSGGERKSILLTLGAGNVYKIGQEILSGS
ncbi:UDP-N-acetylmuramate--L-alanine ligase [Spirochaetota bacterium]